MKRWVIFAGIVFFALVFTAACSNHGDGDQTKNSRGGAGDTENVQLTISAAASLKEALETIRDHYQKEHPETTLTFNFGGSGSLQKQISQGAPVDLFFSAAKDKFELLVDAGLIAKEDGVDLLENSLVLVVPKGGQSVKNFADLAKPEVKKISIGIPETVPAGTYAKESLVNTGIWKDVEDKIVYAKDVRQVLSYVETGNVDAGIVYKTDALVSEKADIAAEADPATHTPVVYPVGVIKDSKNYDAAKKFFEYLQTDEAIEVFEEHGFSVKR